MVYDMWSVERNRPGGPAVQYSAEENHIPGTRYVIYCRRYYKVLQIYSIIALTAISLYSLSCLQWAGGEERGHGEEGGLWRGRPAQTHH